MQSNLEKNGIDARQETLVRNDYTNADNYSSLHTDAIGNGDPLGKGTGIGGHIHSVPGQTTKRSIDYSNLDTTNGGGVYDVEGRNGVGGRNFLKNISLYNENNEYGAHLIDTSANEGQVRF
jgi:hypothetical protein